GWSVGLVSALFVLSGKENNQKFAWLALIPPLALLCLDGYFLGEEPLYRKRFDEVRKRGPAKIDFSMDTRDFLKDVGGWLKAVSSKTLIPFHGVIVGAILLVTRIL